MGSSIKKRSFSDAPKGRAGRPAKKPRRVVEYHSSSDGSASSDNDDDDGGAPIPANLLDSDDEDLDNIEVDDGASTAESGSGSDSDSGSASEPARPTRPKPPQPSDKKKQAQKQTPKPFVAKDAPDSSSDASSADDDDDDADDADDDDDDDDNYLSDAASGDGDGDRPRRPPKSKRNDPSAFAESMSKMLSSKLPASRRADPIVARSAAAAERARQAADSALEAKARKRLREQRRLALEKGRVRDVLVASTRRTLNLETGEVVEVPDEEAARGGEPATTAEILAQEKRLRKVAQRGVVKLFNAVRAAQVKAHEAERAARREGIVGMKRKEEKVTEMSRKGFLDLIASGGGGLKKGGLEEA
ncbi:hypothetical protein VTJ83DRAFT_3859 [Remersonia thermophila]|uniref:Ribosomal RNA-processing protein 15 n=1 Tax=Remersonia thermophila TaxID=72144 RepID=A0ABR4DF78_9PEZI